MGVRFPPFAPTQSLVVSSARRSASANSSSVEIRRLGGEHELKWTELTGQSAFNLRYRLIDKKSGSEWLSLGKLAWADYAHQKNIAPQVMMATTNGTFGSGTFGISSGTSGCTNDGKVMAEHKTTVFAQLNFENLSQEMAQGQGEHLASLATLMGVPAEQHASFFVMTQERYISLVKAEEASPGAMVTAIHDVLAVHPVLARVSMR